MRLQKIFGNGVGHASIRSFVRSAVRSAVRSVGPFFGDGFDKNSNKGFGAKSTSALVVLVSIALLLGFFPPLAGAAPLTLPQLKKDFHFFMDHPSVDGKFSQTKSLKDVDVKIQAEGHFSMRNMSVGEARSKAWDVEWVIDKPSRVAVRLNSERIEIQSADGVIQKYPMKDLTEQSPKFSSLLVWMKMNPEELSQNYQVEKQAGSSKKATAPVFVMTPRDSAQPFDKVEVQLRPDGAPQTFRIIEKSGDELQIDFKAIKVVSSK
jgi:hypothetical protein